MHTYSTTYYTYIHTYMHNINTYIHFVLSHQLKYSYHVSVCCLPQGSAGFTTDKALSSSCFHALVSSFVPLMLLDSPAYSLAVGKVHSWLRLLVSYHAPALVQHLDRWQLCMHVCIYVHCYACRCMFVCMYAFLLCVFSIFYTMYECTCI